MEKGQIINLIILSVVFFLCWVVAIYDIIDNSNIIIIASYSFLPLIAACFVVIIITTTIDVNRLKGKTPEAQYEKVTEIFYRKIK